MEIIKTVFNVISVAITASIIAVIVLMLVRLILNYADLNPFSRLVLTVRRLTDPFIAPVRRAIASFGFGPNVAPLIVILLAILVGWFALNLAETILNTAAGVLDSAQGGKLVAVIGHLLYGFLAVYSLLIFIRIIFSWGAVGRSNSVMRFLMRATDPLLVPLRRMIPPLGMFDLSPIVAFFIIWLFQAAIVGTLLRGLKLNFIG
ncbi:MAG: YggT family protein [Pyrinomonadaceae bacterium]|nr:YggT family protein [Pyrinomonadaceae bacterium]